MEEWLYYTHLERKNLVKGTTILKESRDNFILVFFTEHDKMQTGDDI